MNQKLKKNWWLQRPNMKQSLFSLCSTVLIATLIVLSVSHSSPLATRNNVAIESLKIAKVYLTTLPHNHQRVVFQTKRRATGLQRGKLIAQGKRFWIRRYHDHQRPTIPQRRLLTSRNRGVHLFVPAAAINLSQAISHISLANEDSPGIDSRFVYLFENRQFQGMFLHLRFPKPRDFVPQGYSKKQFELVIVRGNLLLTVDCFLYPYPSVYSKWIADGKSLPEDLICSQLDSQKELVMMIHSEQAVAPVSLHTPVSLFSELKLAWGEKVPTVVDDRWRLEKFSVFAPAKTSQQQQREIYRYIRAHLAFGFESLHEQKKLYQTANQVLAK